MTCVVPCVLAMLFAQAACKPLMLVIGQNEANSQAAHEFLQFALAGILQLLSYRVLSQYLRARHAVVPLFCINLAVVIMHYFVCEMFVQGIGEWEGLGFAGVPLALAVAWTLQLVFVGAYLLLSGLAGDLWIGCSVHAFRPSDMGAVIRAGKSLGWMEMLELLVYFAPTLVAGQLPMGSVAAQGIVSTVYLNLWLLFQVRGLESACGCVLWCASHVRLTRVCVCVCVRGCRGLGWQHTSWCASLFVTAQGKRYAPCGGVVGAHGEAHA